MPINFYMAEFMPAEGDLQTNSG